MPKRLFLTLPLLFLCLNIVQAQETVSSLLSRGLQFFGEEKYENAITEFSKVIKNNPADKDAYYYLGLTLLRTEKYSEAVAPLKKVLELDPQYKGARRNLGIAYLHLESNELAIQQFKKSIDQDPQDASAYFYLGRVFQQKKWYKESLIHFQTVLSLDPGMEQISLFQIGVAYLELGQKEDAKLALTLALERDPESDIAGEIESLLDEIGGKTSKSKKDWWFNASMGVQFDDNLSVVKQDVITNQADQAAIFELSTGYKFYSTPDLELRLGYDFYENSWEDTPEFNYQSNTISFGASHDAKGWDTGINYYYNYSFLDTKEFIAFHSIGPRVGFSLHPKLYTNISSAFQTTNFFTDNPRDSINLSIGFDQYLFFMDNKAYGFLNYRYSDEDTEGSEFDFTGNLVSVGVNFSGLEKFNIQLSYMRNLLEYRNNTASIGSERRDEKETVRFLITRPILEFLNFNIDYQYNTNSSNLVSVDSNQNLLIMKIVLSY
ncbi:MAG: tetratricopeptide repeat protein [Nitrospinaceae bacterium]|nr:tetratricopeptide repeat protein [Nitrospinaceae bacterium]